MARTSPITLSMSVAALFLGVLGDLLMRQIPWGLNATLWMTTLLVIAFRLHAREAPPMTSRETGWIFVALLFAWCFCWRDSPVLQSLALAGFLGSVSLAAVEPLRYREKYSQWVPLVLVPAEALTDAVLSSAVWLFAVRNAKKIRRVSIHPQVQALFRGALLSIPVLVVFTSLFAAADAAFEHIVFRAIDIDLETWFVHGFTLFAFTMAGIGMLKILINKAVEFNASKSAAASLDAARERIVIGKIEGQMVLGAAVLLFIVFVSVQARYFFGDDSFVKSADDLTYAEYARRGFFELCTIAVLTVSMLLVLDWVLGKTPQNERKVFYALTCVQVVLLYVVMASALHRMMLYMDQFGLTQLRFYVSAFLIWLAAAVAWFLATVVRGRRADFIPGAAKMAVISVLALFAVNPDGWIMTHNISRAAEGKPFDAAYAGRLSADAAPAYIDGMNAGHVPVLNRFGLNSYWPSATKMDWRSWNWGRARAWLAVEASESD